MTKLIDLTGQRFGRLVVLERAENAKDGSICWKCKCDCGKIIVTRANSLRMNRTKSCGCLQKEYFKTSHKESKTKFYKLWHGIIERCENSTNGSYKNYGAKGITICEEWHNYENFKNWALNNGYKEGLSIDRIDNNKGYYPENCRWVTFIKQQNNKKDNHYITYNGKTQSISDWARELGTKYYTIHARIKRGWTEEEAISIPIGCSKNKKKEE